MKTVKKDKLEYLVFENMPEIKHCFSTRYGGVSEGVFFFNEFSVERR